jgi:predicted esterase
MAAMLAVLTLAATVAWADLLAPPKEPPAGQAAPTEHQSFPPTKKITEFRLWSPSLIYGDSATVRVDIPKRALAGLDLPRTEKPGLRLTVDLRHRGANLQKTAPLPLALSNPELRLDVVMEHFDSDEFWKKSATIALADWPDGEVEVRLRISAAAAVTNKFTEPAPQTFRIIRKPVAAVAAAHRSELQTWLDDRNASRLIWGKLPLWPNLSRALQQPADPYRDLRGFLLRSYFNEQLQRRQPYTLYIPQALDLGRPAPLLILLHGSGGDYRNLVADFAAGQDLEKHPMLIANAGAFYHQEYQHLAFNDVLGVLADVQKKYRVDPDRIYCQGISLGGRGAMEMAALRPGLFAAICAQAPYGATQEPDDLPFFLNQTEWGRWSVARWDLRTYLPNLATTPTQFVYGHRDTVTPPLNALTFAHLLKKRYDGRVEALGFDTDHNITVPHYHWSNTGNGSSSSAAS